MNKIYLCNFSKPEERAGQVNDGLGLRLAANFYSGLIVSPTLLSELAAKLSVGQQSPLHGPYRGLIKRCRHYILRTQFPISICLLSNSCQRVSWSAYEPLNYDLMSITAIKKAFSMGRLIKSVRPSRAPSRSCMQSCNTAISTLDW